jgi:hypothetical protein
MWLRGSAGGFEADEKNSWPAQRSGVDGNAVRGSQPLMLGVLELRRTHRPAPGFFTRQSGARFTRRAPRCAEAVRAPAAVRPLCPPEERAHRLKSDLNDGETARGNCRKDMAAAVVPGSYTRASTERNGYQSDKLLHPTFPR